MERVYLPEQAMLPVIRMARFYSTAQDGRTARTQERQTDCYELSLFLDGSGSITMDSVTFQIHCGDVRFTRPGQMICSDPPFSCCTVFFRLGEDGVCCYNELLDSLPNYFFAGMGLLPVFKRLSEDFLSDEPGSTARRNAVLLELLCDLRRMLHSQRFCRSAVERCMEYMETHLAEKVPLALLGELTGYSPLHILRIFREDTGRSPHEYLSALRIVKARQLLSDTEIPIGELSERCGFSSESYFQAMFKKQSGVTPGQYRKNARLF